MCGPLNYLKSRAYRNDIVIHNHEIACKEHIFAKVQKEVAIHQSISNAKD